MLRFVIAFALVVSLGTNVLLFVGGLIYSFVDEFVDQTLGITTAVSQMRLHKVDLERRVEQQDKKLKNIRDTVGPATKRSKARLVKSIGRTAASVPMKIIPFLGSLAAFGFTAWAIKDLCDTIKDMNEIQMAIGESGAQAEPSGCIRSVWPPW